MDNSLINTINQSTSTAPSPNEAAAAQQNEGLLALILRMLGKDKAVMSRNEEQAHILNQIDQ